MKTTCALLILTGASISALAQVNPEEHADHHPDQSAATQVAPEASKTQPDNSPAADMHRRMQAMQELMSKLEKTTDPAERRRLLEQHREAMHQQMSAMKQMGGMGMMNHGPAGQRPMGGQMMMSGEMMKCHESMQEHMTMMLGMMDQMMRHEEMRQKAQ
jgi:hypothetical protein